MGTGLRGTANHTGLLPARSALSPSTSTFTSPPSTFFFFCMFFFFCWKQTRFILNIIYLCI